MSGRITRTAAERERMAADEREDEQRAERAFVRAMTGGVDIRSAPFGRYIDAFGDKWLRHRGQGGAVATGSQGVVHWPESELADADDTYGPFRRVAGEGGKDE